MKNRRPKLKRAPVLADHVAEEFRKVADINGWRVNIRVILYRQDRDLVIAIVPRGNLGDAKMAADAMLGENDWQTSVTLGTWDTRPTIGVWLSIEERRQ